MEGSGYFDIRDQDDKWMRIACETGDMIILVRSLIWIMIHLLDSKK